MLAGVRAAWPQTVPARVTVRADPTASLMASLVGESAVFVDMSSRTRFSWPSLSTLTLFLRGPDEYEGGELVVEDTYGTHAVKLPAGDLILYPATSLHRVNPVTRGDGRRALLFDLDMAIDQVGRAAPDNPGVTNCYHNLLRQWADVRR